MIVKPSNSTEPDSAVPQPDNSVVPTDAGSPVLPNAITARRAPRAAASSDVLWIDKFRARRDAEALARPAAVAPISAASAVSAAPVTSDAATVIEVPPGLQESSPAAGVASPDHFAEMDLPDDTAEHREAVRFLASLPDVVEKQVQELAGGEQLVTDALLRALWLSLESNTRSASAEWRYVESRHGYAPPDLAIAAGDAGDVLLPRFFDILPPKATAIPDPVRSAEFGGARFLHANRIDLDCGLHLIAAQKPVAGEIAGLHQLLIDQRVGLIVDLTRYQERETHATYAPEQQGTCVSARGRQRLVCCTARSRLHDLKAVRQQLSIDDGANVLRLQRLRFPGWLDHGVIAVSDLIALADTIEVLNTDPRRPILMHCLAGVGRTGTLMSFLAARRRLARLARPGTVCGPDRVIRIVMETVARGRLARGPLFVQMEEQFILLVRALLQGRPGMVERRRSDEGPGFADGGAPLPEARRPTAPVQDAAAVDGSRIGFWRRLRNMCGFD